MLGPSTLQSNRHSTCSGTCAYSDTRRSNFVFFAEASVHCILVSRRASQSVKQCVTAAKDGLQALHWLVKVIDFIEEWPVAEVYWIIDPWSRIQGLGYSVHLGTECCYGVKCDSGLGDYETELTTQQGWRLWWLLAGCFRTVQSFPGSYATTSCSTSDTYTCLRRTAQRLEAFNNNPAPTDNTLAIITLAVRLYWQSSEPQMASLAPVTNTPCFLLCMSSFLLVSYFFVDASTALHHASSHQYPQLK